MKVWTTLLILLAIVIASAALFIYSGVYNVAATQPHTQFGYWLFTTVRDHSIDKHAHDLNPPNLTDSSMIESGARHYSSTCAVCHGAPGEELSEIAKGLNPPPPELDKGHIQKKYADAELYWIVAHGIRMTGMPAFGPTHNEKDLWAIVAFIKELPEIKPEKYESLSESGKHKRSATEDHSGQDRK